MHMKPSAAAALDLGLRLKLEPWQESVCFEARFKFGPGKMVFA